MSEQRTPTVAAMEHAVRAFRAARPDAETLLEGAAAIAEAQAATADSGATNTGGVTATYDRRRMASWRLEVFRSLEAGDGVDPPRLPRAGAADALAAWARRTGPDAILRAVRVMTAVVEEQAQKIERARTAMDPAHWFRGPDGTVTVGDVDALAEKWDAYDAAVARHGEVLAARDAVGAKLSDLFGSRLARDVEELEQSVLTAEALQADVVESDPAVRDARARIAEAEAALGRLASVGVKTGVFHSKTGDDLKAAQADLKARIRELGASAAGSAKALIGRVVNGDPAAVASLLDRARANPNAFGVQAFERLQDLEIEAIQAGGEAARSILCPDD